MKTICYATISRSQQFHAAYVAFKGKQNWLGWCGGKRKERENEIIIGYLGDRTQSQVPVSRMALAFRMPSDFAELGGFLIS